MDRRKGNRTGGEDKSAREGREREGREKEGEGSNDFCRGPKI